MWKAVLGACLTALAVPLPAQEAAGPPAVESMASEIRTLFEKYRADSQVPGTVYGVVQDGRLVLVEGLGVRDTVSGRPVDADTRFRIASMSKAFTALAILHLHDQGKLRLDAPAARYVPQLKRWRLPTADSRAITVRDLLHHTAGFVTDDPWGDRQQVITAPEFSAVIASGMDFANAPGVRNEYSNYGYALLGRIVSNVSGKRYQDYIRDTIMRPLGMSSTGYDIAKSPPAERAVGYSRVGGEWVREPDMRDGAFGAMGGVETTANDYAKWIAFLLSAWPASDEPDNGPIRRATVRSMVALASPMRAVNRAAEHGPPCRQSFAYGAGLRIIDDCDLGRVITHGGGYPGYGSNMILLPDAGVGAFVFNNRTYTGLGRANFQALLTLRRAGAIPDRPQPVSAGLTRAYDAAKQAWADGNLARVPLANNVAMDESLTRRAAALADLKGRAGACSMAEPVVPLSAMEGTFAWSCERGTVMGRVMRAPTSTFQLQVIDFWSPSPPAS